MRKKFCKCLSLSQVDELKLTSSKKDLDIFDILDTFVKIEICSIKVVKGKCNSYIYIEGVKEIKLHCVFDDCSGVTKSVTFLEPFNEHFSIDCNLKDVHICSYGANVVCKEAKPLCKKDIYLYTLFEIIVKFEGKEKVIPPPCPPKPPFDSCKDLKEDCKENLEEKLEEDYNIQSLINENFLDYSTLYDMGSINKGQDIIDEFSSFDNLEDD